MTFERIAPEQHDTLEGIAEPSENPILVGHAEAVATITGAYRSGKLPHATAAGRAARHRQGDVGIPCRASPAFASGCREAPETLAIPDPASSLFRQIAMGAHPAILHLDPALQRQDQEVRDAADRRRDPPRQPLPVDDLA